jgi:hypothetical protein
VSEARANSQTLPVEAQRRSEELPVCPARVAALEKGGCRKLGTQARKPALLFANGNQPQ